MWWRWLLLMVFVMLPVALVAGGVAGRVAAHLLCGGKCNAFGGNIVKAAVWIVVTDVLMVLAVLYFNRRRVLAGSRRPRA